MRNIQIFFLLFSITVIGQKKHKFPQEIASVSFQNWVGGQELSGGGTDFYLEFKKPLLVDIKLIKLYFRNHEFKIDKQSEIQFIGRYHYQPQLKIDQYGNREIVHNTQENSAQKYVLKDDEAILEYTFKGKSSIYKLKSIKEREMIAYP